MLTHKDALSQALQPECPYCGATHGLRIEWAVPGCPTGYICADCFTGRDDGPCFDDLPVYRDPSELPVAISTRWFKTYTRRPFDDHDDYVNVITWADGSTEERNRIPAEWNNIAIATHLRLYEANRASLDASMARVACPLSEVA